MALHVCAQMSWMGKKGVLIRARLLLFAVARRRSYHHALQASTDVPYMYTYAPTVTWLWALAKKRRKLSDKRWVGTA